jgi:HSP20 family protein
MNYANCHASSRNRANVGLPALLNLFLDELPNKYVKNVGGNVNISETDTGYDIEVALPGFEKGDFKVQLDDKYLTISAEKTVSESSETPDKAPERRYIRREFSQSTAFKRTFTLPEQANVNAINAQYNNGVLVVTVGKRVPEKPNVQHIEIA